MNEPPDTQKEHAPYNDQQITKEDLAAFRRNLKTIRSWNREDYKIGEALAAILNGKLYRQQFPSFDAFWKSLNRRGGASYAYALIQHSEIRVELSAIADIQPPAFESQTRALTSLSPEHRAIVWRRAVEASNGIIVTAKQVKQARDNFWIENPGCVPANLSRKSAPHPEPDRDEQIPGVLISYAHAVGRPVRDILNACASMIPNCQDGIGLPDEIKGELKRTLKGQSPELTFVSLCSQMAATGDTTAGILTSTLAKLAPGTYFMALRHCLEKHLEKEIAGILKKHVKSSSFDKHNEPTLF